jgi:hypothetical protein
MNNKHIKNLANPVENSDAMNLQTFTGYYHNIMDAVLKLDGTNEMNASLDMNNKQIINVELPLSDKDVANKTTLTVSAIM